ncbi:MAG TPA: hypothetical protein EYH02_05970 [Ignisphaera aggregans]|uniref:Uncharacterized protein n=1 Tax=Ignisphaera aggregans TaxID=334771 RepID=A0A833DUW4_9CREN|nr:hypothetical protein [Ignisphaera aggregans]
MASEDWKTYKKTEVEIRKGLPDEIHEYLTKTFNVYYVKLPQSLYKQFDIIRDKLIPLTVRFDHNKYNEFCHTFSVTYRSVIMDRSIPNEVKDLIKELVAKTNKFFESKGLPQCVRELKYHRVHLIVKFKNKPLSDAAVVAESEGKTVAKAETDSSGEAVFEIPSGRYVIYVYKHLDEDTYIYEEKSVEVNEDLTLEFNIETTKSSREISRERGGKPLIKEVS